MELKKLLQGIAIKEKYCMKDDCIILDVVISSKAKTKNGIFVCLVGTNTDGHDYALEAVENGCVAVVCEKKLDLNIPQIVVENTRRALGLISANFWGRPADSLKLIGVTGTNGKTSTSMIIKQILMANKFSVGVIGTLGYQINDQSFSCNLTTPDPFKLHEIFNHMKKNKVEYVVMEVSAHAIALEKVYGLCFEIGILTNITQDHLDFFKTMDKYAKTKLSFLKSNFVKSVLINSDDKASMNFDEDMVVSYSIDNPSDCFAMDIVLKINGTSFIVNAFDNILKIKTKLSGRFNVYNILAGISACLMLGVKPTVIETAVRKLERVDGRFNIIRAQKGYVVVDFAHTPDGLENILKNIRQVAKEKRLVCVFGCGGNRDALKRPIMGKIAEKYCDEIIITSDNPRFENPDLIIDDIIAGIDQKQKCTRIVERIEAIKYSLSKLDGDTVVAICGKGGEKYQDINGIMVPYDDFLQVKQLVKKLKV